MSGNRILVIEDDNATQRIMKMFLEKSGYTPVFASSGKAGLEEALKSDAPSVILLDWMLPDLDGPAVCKELRKANMAQRPYVIFLSARQEKADVAAALDSGADDFLGKPFNVAEAQARLRVAFRTVEYHRELCRRICEIESLQQRNQILQELMVKQETQPPMPERRRPAAELPPGRFPIQEVRFVLSAAMLELRLALEKVTEQKGELAFDAHPFAAWAGFAVVPTGHWVDVIFAATKNDIVAWFESSLRRAPQSDAELIGFVSELCRFAAQGLGRTAKTRWGSVVFPLQCAAADTFQKGGRPPMPFDGTCYSVTIEGRMAMIAIAPSTGARRTIPVDRLKPLDILNSPYPPESVSAVPLLKAGVVLNERVIEKLTFQAESDGNGCDAEIWRPTQLAAYFQGSVRRAGSHV